MAGQIRVTPETLRDQAKTYSQSSEEVAQMISRLDSLNSQIDSEWDGAAFDKYMEQYSEMKPKITDFQNLLEQVYQQLMGAAQTLEDTDQQLSQGFGFN